MTLLKLLEHMKVISMTPWPRVWENSFTNQTLFPSTIRISVRNKLKIRSYAHDLTHSLGPVYTVRKIVSLRA